MNAFLLNLPNVSFTFVLLLVWHNFFREAIPHILEEFTCFIAGQSFEPMEKGEHLLRRQFTAFGECVDRWEVIV